MKVMLVLDLTVNDAINLMFKEHSFH